MSFLSLAKALLTFCCLHRSLVLVKIFLVMFEVLRQERERAQYCVRDGGYHLSCQEFEMLDLFEPGFRKFHFLIFRFVGFFFLGGGRLVMVAFVFPFFFFF